MAGLSDIEWTDATWNPFRAVSWCRQGAPSYAMRWPLDCRRWSIPLTQRVTRKSGNVRYGRGDYISIVRPSKFLCAGARRDRVFVNSMSDLFQDGVPGEFIRDVWHVMERAHWHTFQVLTEAA